jgi:hypothetical protein
MMALKHPRLIAAALCVLALEAAGGAVTPPAETMPDAMAKETAVGRCCPINRP